MVSQCVNPQCGKPLHYLRDGKVFLLEVQTDQRDTARMEHFWLCGECSAKFVVRQAGSRVEVVSKHKSRRPAAAPQIETLPIAS
jgi:hypothetical protein